MTQAVAERSAPAATEQVDPFFYGWRFVRRTLPDGNETLEQVALTADDVLHPQEDDFVVQSDDHQRICAYLYDVLRGRFKDDPGAVVLHDTLVAWDVPGLRPLSPDIAMIFGVRERRAWGTFDVAAEGARPRMVIEVTSPATREVDLARKLDAYDIAEVPLYVIVDSYERKGMLTRRLLGYQMTPQGYVGLAPDERGWLWMEPVGLWIGIRENQIECYHTDGRYIEDYAEVLAARIEAETRAETAEARAQAERQARTQAEARLADLEAELRRLRGEP
jgi:Uma2 family endonuclease